MNLEDDERTPVSVTLDKETWRGVLSGLTVGSMNTQDAHMLVAAILRALGADPREPGPPAPDNNPF